MRKSTLLLAALVAMASPAIAGNRAIHCDAVFINGELTTNVGVSYDDPSYSYFSTSTDPVYTMGEGDELVVTIKQSANCQVTTSATDGEG